MKTKSKNLFAPVMIVLAVAVLIVLVIWERMPDPSNASTISSAAMGSVLSAQIYGGAEDIAQQVQTGVRDLDNRISRTVKSSYISLINEKSEYKTDEELTRQLRQLLDIGERADGAFNIGIGALSDLWDVESDLPRVPSDREIAKAAALTKSEDIVIIGDTVRIPEGMTLDLGAAGKGMACDEAKRIMDADGSVKGAVVSSGGSILLYGKNPNKSFWTVGVRDPEGAETAIMGRLKLTEGFVSTSGNYEKYFIIDGTRYCHIISPFDGRPAQSGLKSVTVTAGTGMESDALSTACFVLGVDKSLPVLERFGADAVFITDDNKVIVTDGLKDSFEITNGEYAYAEDIF